MQRKFVAFFSLVGVLAVGLPVFAHHGAVAYDESKEVVLKGATVTKFAWARRMKTVRWSIGLANWAAHRMITLQGWTKASVQPGDVITIYIHQAKTGNPVGRISRVMLADGTQLHDSAGTSGGGEGGARGGSN